MIDKSKIKELAEFLGTTERHITAMYNLVKDDPGHIKFVNLSVDDWKNSGIDQSDRKQVENWFKQNLPYLYELSELHSHKLRKKITKQVIEISRMNKVETILDYGGGIAEDSIKHAEAGFIASMADLPSHTMDFAKWRTNKRGLKIDFIPIKNDTPLKQKYDAITCFEVLQHLYNPEKVARHLIDHLHKGGILFLTTRFDNPEYPIALEKNRKYEEGMVEFLVNNGLMLVKKFYQYGEGRKTKHLYIYQKA